MYYFMISSNITNIGTWGRVRLRRATFELLEFSPVPPSSYLRMSPECTPRASPSIFPEEDHAEEEHGEEEDDAAPSPRMLSGHKMEPRPPCDDCPGTEDKGIPAYLKKKG